MSLFIALSLAASTTLAQSSGDPAAVNVRIETDAPKVELFRISGESVGQVVTNRGSGRVGITHFQRECRAPCQMRILEPRDDFFIAGEGIVASDRFSLLGYGEDVTLRVKPGSAAMRFGGWTAVTLGVVGAVLGGTALLLNQALQPTGSLGSGDALVSNEVAWAGLIGGGVLLGAGIPLIAFSGTDVEFLPQTSSGAAPRGTRL